MAVILRRPILGKRKRRRAFAVFIFIFWFGALLAQEGVLDLSDPKTSVVYDRTSTIRFPHNKHSKTACSTCHATAATSTRSANDLSPTKNSCTGCHNDVEPKMSSCSDCHLNYPIQAKPGQNYKDVRPQPMPKVARTPRLRFDHKSHVARLSATETKHDAVCTTCHDNATGVPDMPSEKTCTNCHTAQNAPTACATCHITDPKTKRVRTSFVETQRTLKPSNHSVDFLRRHAGLAQITPDDCASCHTEDQCAKCHVEQRASNFAVHPENFLQIHSLSARSEQGKCNDCHNPQTFCFQCHTQAGAVTTPSADPPARLQYHPAGWLDPSFVSNHGVNARRNIVECASCHRENDCVACHAGINPHPADFIFTCRKWLEANAKPCAKCHDNLDDLIPLCR